MKHLKKIRFRESAVLLIVGVFLGLLFVQQVFMNTTEAQQKAKKFNPASNQLKGSTNTQQKVMKFNPVTDQLKGSTKAPPFLQELNKGKVSAKAEQQRKLPTMKELMDIVSKQPGGKEKIRRARTKGKTSGIGSEMTGILLSGLSELNPFKVEVAHAIQILQLRPSEPYKYIDWGWNGYMIIYGALRGYVHKHDASELLSPAYSSVIGYNITKPMIFVKVVVPRSDWYLINFELYNGAKAYLKTYQSGSGSTVRTIAYPTVQTWDTLGSRQWVDLPAMLNLAKGTHYFYWVLQAGRPYIYRVTVQEL